MASRALPWRPATAHSSRRGPSGAQRMRPRTGPPGASAMTARARRTARAAVSGPSAGAEPLSVTRRSRTSTRVEQDGPDERSVRSWTCPSTLTTTWVWQVEDPSEDVEDDVELELELELDVDWFVLVAWVVEVPPPPGGGSAPAAAAAPSADSAMATEMARAV
jgi:hypothetical protein